MMNELKPEQFEQLIASYIEGDLSDEEKQTLDAWFEAHPEDKQYVEELQQAYAALGALDQPALPDSTLSASNLVLMNQTQKGWWRWTWAAAACLAFFILCFTQGFSVRMGSFNVAFGPVPPNQSDSNLHVVQQLINANEDIAERQVELENTLKQLSVMQKQHLALNRLEIERFTSEVVRELNKYLSKANNVAFMQQKQSNHNN